jgi:catechol 2,3-dioxygenase
MSALPVHHAAPFHPRRLGHANLFVGDYEQAAEFYRDIAGFEEVYRQPDNRASFHSNGNTYHDLGLTDIKSHYAAPGQQPDLFHLALEVDTETNLVAGYERSKADGVQYAFVADHDVARSLYLSDPDGNLFELYADVVRDWRSARHGIIIKEKPQWVPGVTNAPLTEPLYPHNPEIRIVRDAVFHPERITHMGIVTKNYAAMLGFYTEVVGLAILAGGATASFAVLQGTAGIGDLTFYRPRPGLKPGLHHLGFQVRDDGELDRSVRECAAKSVPIERSIDSAVRRNLTIRDPDGLRLDFGVLRDWSPAAINKLDPDTALAVL